LFATDTTKRQKKEGWIAGTGEATEVRRMQNRKREAKRQTNTRECNNSKRIRNYGNEEYEKQRRIVVLNICETAVRRLRNTGLA
jgi:hypothetical protein